MAQITVDLSGRYGFDDANGMSNLNNYTAKDGSIVNSSPYPYNPYIRPGYLSPAPVGSSVSVDQAWAAQPCASIYDPVNDDFYFAEMGTQLYKGDTTSDTSLARQISISSAVIRDLEIYTVDGDRKLFVTYKNGSNKADIAISNLPYDTGTDDLTWLTATVSGAFSNGSTGDIFMRVADNGFAYLFMENQVHKIDGTSNGGSNGTATANVLVFPASFRLVDAVDWRGSMFIAVHQYTTDTRNATAPTLSGQSDVGVYVWDRNSTSVSSQDYIPVTGATEISKVFISPSGKLRLFVKSTLGTTEIREYDGAGFKTIKVVGANSWPTFIDSVQNFGGMTLWHGKDGYLWGYGTVWPGTPEGLYMLGRQSVGTNNGGAILTAIGSGGFATTSPGVYLGYLSAGSAISMNRFNVYMGVGALGGVNMDTSVLLFPMKDIPPMSVVKKVTIYCYTNGAASGSTSAGTFEVLINKNSTAFKSHTVTLSELNRGYIELEINKPFVNNIQFRLTYPSSTALSATNDFCPSYAVIDYTPSVDKG